MVKLVDAVNVELALMITKMGADALTCMVVYPSIILYSFSSITLREILLSITAV